MKTTQALLLILTSLFFGCANTDDSKTETQNASISFYFAPHETNTLTTFSNSHGLTWNIQKASMLPGEIGIHWDQDLNSRNSGIISPVAPRHDVSGKISPKIYGYFAVNLLDTMPIQRLTVPEKHYDHIHMVLLPANAITTDTVKGINNHPELQNNSLYISGTVSNGTETLPFVLENSIIYGENDLGDILFSLEIRNGDDYPIYINPLFDKWFKNVKWAHFTPADTIKINTTTNSTAFNNFEAAFKAHNALGYDTPTLN